MRALSTIYDSIKRAIKEQKKEINFQLRHSYNFLSTPVAVVSVEILAQPSQLYI
jgi:hypothetical protein